MLQILMQSCWHGLTRILAEWNALTLISENSIGKILIRRFQNSEKTPSSSSFVRQHQKLLPAALETLFHRFTALLRPKKTFAATACWRWPTRR
ncbi:MAG: hypothetical protein HFF56_09720 [Lawsonibacter sp.]|nr:hypothetical protein [Lawsonibacter sp.]